MSYQNEYLKKLYEKDTAQIDAFDRMRVSNPNTLLDNKQIFDNSPLFWDDQQTSGSGTTSTHSVNTASTTLAVSANTAGTRVRQTFRWFNYQPGKSQLMMMTFVLGTSGAGITKRIGYFNSANGLFMQQTSDGLAFVIRSSASGSPVDIVTPQSEWNLDQLNGAGRTGITLDPTKVQMLFLDFEWLGTGRVRWGFIINGVIIYCHQSQHSNRSSSVYMSTPNLPLRFEISNDGMGGANSISHICTTVISEGGNEETGKVMGVDTGITPLTLANAGTIYAVIGLRLKSGYFGATIEILLATFLASSQNDAFLWRLYYRPTISGTLTYTALDNSAIEYAIGNGTQTVTAGTIVNVAYGRSQAELQTAVINSLRLGSTIAGSPIEMVIAIMPAGANLGINVGVEWRELS